MTRRGDQRNHEPGGPNGGAAGGGAVDRPAVEAAWSLPAGEVAAALGVDPARGLDPAEVERRRARWGENRLRETRGRSAWAILGTQFKSLVVVLLGAAAAVSLAFGDWVEAIAIAVVLAINAAIGFAAELRAVRSMEALRRLGAVATRVRRGGTELQVPSEELVPGDVVLLDEGAVVTADLRLVEANRLEADEAALTGESVPVAKDVSPVAGDAPVAERPGMLFKGTAVTRGSGTGLATATGMATELGRIARLTAEAEDEATPLEERLSALGRRLIQVTLAVAAATIGAGILAGRDLVLMIETGIALAVAAVPEGLPIVATLALARGMLRMARRNALINRLAAVETLGATTLILTDKTGTLTENRMTVRHYALPAGDYRVDGEGLELDGAFHRVGAGGDDGSAVPERVSAAGDVPLRAALEAGLLCNNASIGAAEPGSGEADAAGDPLEAALLVAGAKAGLRRQDLLAELPEAREEAFDRPTQMMATFHRRNGGFRVAVKGAAERVLEASTALRTAGGIEPLGDRERERWLERNRELAADGLRVIALAEREAASSDEEPYRGLTFLGLAGLRDPPRDEVRAAIAACRRAGVRVVMVTGDQPATAAAIARAVGLLDQDLEAASGELDRSVARVGRDLPPLAELSAAEREALRRVPIFARVDPAQKLDLIALHQEAGEVVAMTGDGVNDAPALKKADIGVAMGRRGTQVAQEASDMVLKDDSFGTIVDAIHQGRVIFGNIRRFVRYLLSCNVSEIMIVAGATALDTPLPILPLQILFLNLVTDVFPALALAFGEGGDDVMERPPRDPAEPILARRHWQSIAGYGALITAAVLGALLAALHGLGFSDQRAVTVSFLTLATAQLWHVFSMRDRGSGPIRNSITRNPWVWGALALCAGLLIAAVYLPGLAAVLGVVDPGPAGWALAVGASLVPFAVGQVLRSRPPRDPSRSD